MPPVPSKQVLLHLAQLRGQTSTTTSTRRLLPQCCNKRNSSSSSSPWSRHHSPTLSNECQAQRPRRSTTNIYSNQQRDFTTTRSSPLSSSTATTAADTGTKQRPSQNDVEAEDKGKADSTPDITNYYTLFPSTIPHGPPSPSSSSSSALKLSSSSSSSSSSTETNTFSIPLPALRKEFLHLQSRYHPDKYDPSTRAHQKALALSSLINNAYRTLADPLLRAQYLLRLNYDVDVTTEDNAAHPTDQETLMDVMDAQERIEEAGTQHEVDLLMDENLKRINDTVSKMSEAFEKGDVDAAKNECVRLKYWNSLHQGLHDWEPGKEVRLIH